MLIERQYPETDRRLRNWGRVVRGGYGAASAARCATAIVCDRLRAKRGLSATDHVDAPDERDAWVVEAAWRELSDQHKKVLRINYVRNSPIRRASDLLAAVLAIQLLLDKSFSTC